MPEPENTIRYIQITIRLGSRQTVNIQADNRVAFGETHQDLCFERHGIAGEYDTNDLVDEVLTKLQAAFGKKRTISLSVDGEEIVASSQD